MQRRGIGVVIMGRVIDVFYEAIQSMGLPALTCRALDPKVADFYRRLGFVDYGPDDPKPRLLLPAQDVVELKRL